MSDNILGSSSNESGASSEINHNNGTTTTPMSNSLITGSPVGQLQGFYYEHNPNAPKLKGRGFEDFETYWKDYKNYLDTFKSRQLGNQNIQVAGPTIFLNPDQLEAFGFLFNINKDELTDEKFAEVSKRRFDRNNKAPLGDLSRKYSELLKDEPNAKFATVLRNAFAKLRDYGFDVSVLMKSDTSPEVVTCRQQVIKAVYTFLPRPVTELLRRSTRIHSGTPLPEFFQAFDPAGEFWIYGQHTQYQLRRTADLVLPFESVTTGKDRDKRRRSDSNRIPGHPSKHRKFQHKPSSRANQRSEFRGRKYRQKLRSRDTARRVPDKDTSNSSSTHDAPNPESGHKPPFKWKGRGKPKSSTVLSICGGTSIYQSYDKSQFTSCWVGQYEIRFLRDSGSTISVLNQADYERIRETEGVGRIYQSSDRNVVSASAHEVPSIGYVDINVRDDVERQLKLSFMISPSTPSLLGWQDMRKLGYREYRVVHFHEGIGSIDELEFMDTEEPDGQGDPYPVDADLRRSLMDRIVKAEGNVGKPIRLGGCKIEPQHIKLYDHAMPFKAAPIPQSPKQLDEIDQATDERLALKLIAKVRGSRFISQAMSVPKGRDSFRVVTSLKRINKVIRSENYFPDPPEHILEHLRGNVVFATFDGRAAFDQIPLHESSREYLAFATRKGIFVPQVIPMGMKTSVSILQRSLEKAFAPLIEKKKLHIYVDDFLLMAKSPEELAQLVIELYELANTIDFRFNTAKTRLFLKSANWAGLNVCEDGIQRNAKSTEKFLEIDRPETMGKLSEFMGILAYLKAHIPWYAEKTAPLYALIDAAVEQYSCDRTKDNLDNIVIEDDKWPEDAIDAFENLRDTISRPIKLRPRDPKKQLIMYSDASDIAVSVVIGQVDEEHRNEPTAGRFEILALESHRFTGPSANWKIQDKEACAIVYAYRRYPTLMLSGEIIWYCDNMNVTKLLSRSETADLSKPNTLRWERFLDEISGLTYQIRHIEGEKNCLADFCSRQMRHICLAILRNPLHIPLESVDHDVLHNVVPNGNIDILIRKLIQFLSQTWSVPTHVPSTDTSHASTCHTEDNDDDDDDETLNDDQRVLNDDNINLYLPHEHPHREQLFKLCLLIAQALHRETLHGTVKAMLAYAKGKKLTISILRKFCELIRSNCLICMMSRRRKRLIPFGTPINGDSAGELARVDSLHLPKNDIRREDPSYAIVVKDDFSGMVFLERVSRISAEAVKNVLSNYLERVPECKHIITDNGREYVNATVKNFLEKKGVKYSQGTPYASQSNGSVERTNRDINSDLRKLVWDNMTDTRNWDRYLPMVQDKINYTPSEARADYSPVTIMRRVKVPLCSRVPDQEEFLADDEYAEVVSAVRVQRERDRSSRKGERERSRGLDKNVIDVGDYVLEYMEPTFKLGSTWRGPHRVTEILSEGFAYRVQPIVGKLKSRRVHRSALQLFHKKDLRVSEAILAYAGYTNDVRRIEKIIDISRGDKSFELLTKFSNSENPEWIDAREAYKLDRLTVRDHLTMILETDKPRSDILNDIEACCKFLGISRMPRRRRSSQQNPDTHSQ